MSKRKANSHGFVYSTNPDFKYEEEPTNRQTLQPGAQKLTVKLDTKHRAGKAVTLVRGFIGTQEDLEAIGRQLKNFCGTGGSVKAGEIIIQGDQMKKAMDWLKRNGYGQTKIV